MGQLPAKNFFTKDFCLCGSVLNLKFCFGGNSRHNDRVDSLWERATKQAVMTVIRWHRNQIIKGLLVIG